MQNICKEWNISNDEYFILNEKFGDLCEYQSWDLIKRNTRCNHTDEQTDIAQELRMALIRAGSYYKRQVYIEKCLELCLSFASDKITKKVIAGLQDLWDNKTRHGANRQKFGPEQEKLLEKMVRKIVPKKDRPDRNANLELDAKFTTYCKSITWNAQKAMGKKITREKQIRSQSVSLSEYEYLAEKY